MAAIKLQFRFENFEGAYLAVQIRLAMEVEQGAQACCLNAFRLPRCAYGSGCIVMAAPGRQCVADD